MSGEIQCPLCSSYKTSTTLGSKAKTGGIYLAGLGASALANSALSCIGLGGIRTNVAGATREMLKSVVPMDYKCNCCDCIFTVMFIENQNVKSVKVKQYPIPDGIIQEEKEAYAKQLESEISYGLAAFFGLIDIGLFVYCWRASFSWSWLFWAFLFWVFLISTIVIINGNGEAEKKLEKVKEQNLKAFKLEHPELFEKYDQKKLADYYKCHSLKKDKTSDY